MTVMVIFNTAKKIKSQNLGFGLALIVRFCMYESSVLFFLKLRTFAVQHEEVTNF